MNKKKKCNKIKSPRNFDGLFVHKSTLKCALKLCIPCLYKINPFGIWKNPYTGDFITIRPNQRPELCFRSKSESYDGLYIPGQRVLILGDGDFSFSLSIVKGFGKMSKNVVCTSYESRQSVVNTYQREHILRDLESYGALIYNEIDATCLDREITKLPYNTYDRIIWNFPCVRVSNGFDGQTTELMENTKLLEDFFKHASLLLRNTVNSSKSEVHITHKTVEPFCWWHIEEIGNKFGFNHTGSIIFDRYLYPGYINRKVLDKKSFPLNDALVYIFQYHGDVNRVDDKVTSTKTEKWNQSTLSSDDVISLNQPEIIESLVEITKKISISISSLSDEMDHFEDPPSSSSPTTTTTTIVIGTKRKILD